MLEQATQFAIVAKGLESGPSYQDAFADRCKPEWMGAFPVTGEELPGYGHGVVVGTGAPYRAICEEIKLKLADMPRGTWATFTMEFANGHTRTYGIIGDGNGSTHERDGRVSADMLIEDMVQMELYLARRNYDRSLQVSQAQACVIDRGYRPGMVLKEIEVDGMKFSTAHIISITEEGKVSMACTRRGSARRWNAQILAHGLSETAHIAPIAATKSCSGATASLF